MSPVALLLLAAGTYAFRLAGPLLRGRVRLPARVDALLADAAVVLLLALAATGAVFDGRESAGWARPAGVVVAALLVLARRGFPLVVLGAAATTAGIRLLGL